MTAVANRTLQQLRAYYLAPLLQQLDDFWSWWTGELISLLPQNLRSAILQDEQRLLIEVDGPDLVITAGESANAKELGRLCADTADNDIPRLPMRVTETVLLLPTDKVLVKRLTLPLAAAENLREVLSFEMDRQTPFKADQVYYDSIVVQRNGATRTLLVDLVLSPRHEVDELLRRLAGDGLHPHVISIPGPGPAQRAAINLLPASARKPRNQTSRNRNRVLAAACLALVTIAIALPLVQKQQVLRELEPQVELAIAEAKKGNDLRQQVEQLVAASRYLTNRKRAEHPLLRVLDEVTRILPDHTWITRVDIDSREIQLQGQSSTSAALISLLEASPLLEEAQFRSPVMRIGSSDQERFHLSANIAQEQRQ